ncbi:NAD(P)H-dependent oxidoreductase [Luteimonas sp. Y-2-2-4F]|nr:NAD(P)H-dependent oxidoreductase [Luteimonas sp. Y-2-2-4F]MCD9031139.1 NAD(P)H-dependent oxidoreductase [Luteimonas sp. Y-2-2-4F]
MRIGIRAVALPCRARPQGRCEACHWRSQALRYSPRGIPQALLKGRSARVLMTADSPGWYLRLLQGQPTRRQLVRSTLRYCGFRPVDFVRYGPVHGSDDDDRARWLEDAARRGAADARRRWAP